jgi:SAM-dependent methyltransferase
MSWRKYLLIPKLIWYSSRATRDQGRAWDGFWSSVQRTGPGGDVLWDAADETELQGTLGLLRTHMDPHLPIVDVGCGNGRYTRAIAAQFPRAVGIDVSPHAIARARQESAHLDTISYRVQDVGQPDVGRTLATEWGEMNVFVRGVLHVLPPNQRRVMVENVRTMVGQKGTLYLVETALKGDPLDHLEYQGATQGSIPDPLFKCIVNGVRPPEHFDEDQYHRYLSHDQWETLASGPTSLYTLPLHNKTGVDILPAFFAIARARSLASA